MIYKSKNTRIYAVTTNYARAKRIANRKGAFVSRGPVIIKGKTKPGYAVVKSASLVKRLGKPKTRTRKNYNYNYGSFPSLRINTGGI